MGDTVNYKALYKGSNATDTYSDGKTYHDEIGHATITQVDTTKAVWYKFNYEYAAENDITGIYNPTSNDCVMPVRNIFVTTDYSPQHMGIDLAWNRDHGGMNQDIFAPYDCTVFIARNSNDGAKGKYVVVQFDYADGNRYFLELEHFNDVKVVAGQSLKKFDSLGDMGSTGDSTGNHVHVSLYKGVYGNRATYAINPADLLMVPDDFYVGEETRKNYNLVSNGNRTSRLVKR